MKEKIIIDLNEKILEFVNKEISITKDDFREKIKNIVEFTLLEEKLSFDKTYISIDATDSENIRKINCEFRGIDKSTDVLSFPIFTKEELEVQNNLSDDKKIKELELGDIILCLDIVKEHSIEYKTGILREILYMITHGVCHLVGHDHIEESDKIKMRTLEEKVLSKLGVSNEKE